MKPLDALIAAMPSDERDSLLAGFQRSQQQDGFTGSLEEFTRQQQHLYNTVGESDPRHRTFFYGRTLLALNGLKDS